MKNTLIQIYLFVCQIYDTSSSSCFQRLSNNCQPDFTDQELITIWLFAHLNDKFRKKQMHSFITQYWSDWFPRLPSYQTFVFRLNQLEPSFQTFGQVLLRLLTDKREVEIDSIIDSFPVMLAQQGHSYSAKVAREIAAAGFCAAKKTRFHGVRLHFIAHRRSGRLPVPKQIWLCSAAHHDSKAFKEQKIDLSNTTVFGDLAFADKQINEFLKEQETEILTPKKKPKGIDNQLTEVEKYRNQLIAKLRQPIESLFNWINQKTELQRASQVRSTNGLFIHCWGKLVFAFWLLVFYY
jgi:hypothetical protein